MTNKYLLGFREDISGTIFTVSGKTWKMITILYLIQTLIAGVLIVGGFWAFGLFDLLTEFNSLNDPTEILKLYTEIAQKLLAAPGFMGFITFILIVMILLGSWSYYLAFLLTKEYILTEQSNFKEKFLKSFKPQVFRIALLSIIILLIFVLGIAVGTLLSKTSGFLSFLIIVIWFVYMCRFVLALPALVLGSCSIADAISFSFNHISYKRALQLFGIFFLTILALIVAALAVGLVSGLLSLIPFLGNLIKFLIQIVFGGYTLALTISALSGLYYRFAEDMPEAKGIEVEVEDEVEDSHFEI